MVNRSAFMCEAFNNNKKSLINRYPMILKIIALSIIVCTPVTVWSAESVILNNCNVDRSYLEIYSKAIKQSFEAVASSSKISKNDVTMFTVNQNTITSTLNKEFDTKKFGNACFASGKIYSFIYDDPSIIEFGIYHLTFSNKKEVEYILSILHNVQRKHFRTKKIPTLFTWFNNFTSIFIFYETILVGHEPLEHLAERSKKVRAQ